MPSDQSPAVDRRHTSCYIDVVKFFDWNDAKNQHLIANRGVSFEAVVIAIAHGGLLDVIVHPNQTRYAGQQIFIIAMEHHVFLVPFVEDEHTIFLKTIIPSRKMTRKYLRNNQP